MPRPGSRARKHQGWDTCKDNQGNKTCSSRVDKWCWEAIIAHTPVAYQASTRIERHLIRTRRYPSP